MKISFARTKHRRWSRKRKKLAKLKQACLAVGLATAWSGEANAELTFTPSITPTQTISNAWIYYHQNATSPLNGISLGILPANQTTTFEHPNPLSNFPDNVWFSGRSGYVVIGLYDNAGEPSVAVSMPDASAILASQTWEQLFTRPEPFYYSEAEVVAELQQGNFPSSFMEGNADYFDDASGQWVQKLVTPIGDPATLVGFSTATFLGAAHVPVPEPSSLVLVVCSLGVFGVAARTNRCRTTDRS
jgi:hypothetical protein